MLVVIWLLSDVSHVQILSSHWIQTVHFMIRSISHWRYHGNLDIGRTTKLSSHNKSFMHIYTKNSNISEVKILATSKADTKHYIAISCYHEQSYLRSWDVTRVTPVRANISTSLTAPSSGVHPPVFPDVSAIVWWPRQHLIPPENPSSMPS